MRETFNLRGRKQLVTDIEQAVARVAEVYPTAIREGSVGHWTWLIRDSYVGHSIVAEAWLPRNGAGWWLKIKKPSE